MLRPAATLVAVLHCQLGANYFFFSMFRPPDRLQLSRTIFYFSSPAAAAAAAAAVAEAISLYLSSQSKTEKEQEADGKEGSALSLPL